MKRGKKVSSKKTVRKPTHKFGQMKVPRGVKVQDSAFCHDPTAEIEDRSDHEENYE